MRVISGIAKGTNLYTLEGEQTRPTLDRVKEALFNMLQHKVRDAIVLDVFAGSGALGIEALSRGASKAIFCDKSVKAIQVIQKNIEKTHLQQNSKILQMGYEEALESLIGKYQFDLIFLDPPYEKNLAVDAVAKIENLDLLKEDGIIVLETDQEQRELQQLEKLNVNVYDLRKYGRIKLIFLNRKG